MINLTEQVRRNKYYGINKIIAEKYISTLELHIHSVKEAGEKLNVSSDQLDIHDDSKWSEAEFPGYAMHFQGGGAPDLFAKAWNHHIHSNPHHWQHWIFSDGFTPKDSDVENGIIEMPYKYVWEMVADWMGSEMAYQGKWDMTDWLIKNLPKIKVHSKTAEYLKIILCAELGYEKVYQVINGNNQ